MAACEPFARDRGMGHLDPGVTRKGVARLDSLYGYLVGTSALFSNSSSQSLNVMKDERWDRSFSLADCCRIKNAHFALPTLPLLEALLGRPIIASSTKLLLMIQS